MNALIIHYSINFFLMMIIIIELYYIIIKKKLDIKYLHLV